MVAPVGSPAAELLERARRANDEDRLPQAVAFATAGLAELEREPARAEDDRARSQLRSQLLRTLAYAEGRMGRTDTSLDLLDRALTADPAQEPAIAAARAATLYNAGRSSEALVAFDRAIPLLSATPDLALVSALLNRGVLHMTAGRLSAAAADTASAATVAAELGLTVQQAFAEYNLGYIHYLRGDLCRALEVMAGAADTLPPAALATFDLDRSRVLSAAGLAVEAAEYAESAVAGFAAVDANHDLAAAYLVAAEARVATGEFAAARELTRRSREISRRLGNRVHQLLADLIDTGLLRSGPVPPTSADLLDLAGRLAEAGLTDQAATARLSAADTAVRDGDRDRAREILASVPVTEPSAGSGLTIALQRHLVTGRIELAEGRTGAGLAALAAGLDDLARVQAGFGSQDLQTATAVHGRELAGLALRTVTEIGEPGAVLEWLDRVRAVSTRLPAVRPPADPRLAADLAELRVATSAALDARVAGNVDTAAEERVATLRRTVRDRTRMAAGEGVVRPPLTVDSVIDRLGPSEQLLAVTVLQDRLHRVVVDRTGAEYRDLGPVEPLRRAIRSAAADLDVLAMPRTPRAIGAVARGSLDRCLGQIAELLLPPEVQTGRGDLVVAAVGEIATLPWNLLPWLRGRPVRVNASVTAALDADRPAPIGATSQVVLVAGPGVQRGDQEVTEVAAGYHRARVLTGVDATGAALVAAANGADLVHIAAHGVHEPDNPQFSGLLLADGPLFAYDLAPVDRLPQHVVLSSCDVGRSADRPGGEPLGLTAALLRFGVPSVVAGVTRIADDVAAPVMTEYHRRLLAGDRPACALAAAVAAVDEPAALVCFGA